MTCRSQEDIWFPHQNPRLKKEVRISSSCWTTEEETQGEIKHWESLGLIHVMQTGIAVNCSEQSWLRKLLFLIFFFSNCHWRKKNIKKNNQVCSHKQRFIFSLQPSSASCSVQKHVCFGSHTLLKSVWPKSKGPISPDELNELCPWIMRFEHIIQSWIS